MGQGLALRPQPIRSVDLAQLVRFLERFVDRFESFSKGVERSFVELAIMGVASLALVAALMGAFREAVGPFDKPSDDPSHPCDGTGFVWVWVDPWSQ